MATQPVETSEILDRLIFEIDLLRDYFLEVIWAKFQHLQSIAWDAWQRSCLPKTKTTKKVVRDAKGEREETVTIIEESKGDPRYLSLCHKLIADHQRWWEKYTAQSKKPTAPPPNNPRADLAALLQSAMSRGVAAK